MKDQRWKSPVLWGAVVAQVLSLLLVTGIIDTGMSEVINTIAVAVLELLTLFGVLNNPTDKQRF